MSHRFYQILFQNETLYAKPLVAESVKNEDIRPKNEEKDKANPLQKSSENVVVVRSITPQTQHKVLVLVNEMSASEGVFLNKILSAIGLSTDTVDLINIADTKNLDFKPLLENKKVHHIISFGVPFLKVNIDVMMNRYDPKTAAGVTLLLSEPLAVVEADDTHKRTLWNILKKIFL